MNEVGYQTTLIVKLILACAALIVCLDLSLRPIGIGIAPFASIWLAAGLQIGVVLMAPKRHWPAYFLALTLTQLAYRFLARGSVPTHSIVAFNVSFTLIDIAFVIVACAYLARDKAWVDGHSDSLASWTRFMIGGALLFPAVKALGGATLVGIFIAAPASPADFLRVWSTWLVNNALGVAVLTPIILRIRLSQFIDLWSNGRLAEIAALLVLFAGSVTIVFWQDGILPLFLLFPATVFLLFRTGFVGLSLGMGVLIPVSVISTFFEKGPFIAMASGSLNSAMMLCQVFAIVAFGTAVLITALLDEHKQLGKMTAVSNELYELIANRSGDMVFVADERGKVEFISQAAREILGQPSDALLDFEWRAFIHADDLFGIDAAFTDLRTGSDNAECVFRLQHAAGGYRWFESRLRPCRSHQRGGKRLIIGSTRDITAQRLREQELEHMATIDPLTGLANRRCFNEVRRTEWRRCARHREPLSILMIDIDYFKGYNDSYGHAEGDRCLTLVAIAIKKCLKRAGDFCARYGGEEFVAILPDTNSFEAARIGQAIRLAVRGENLLHKSNPRKVVTVSVGAATIVPVGEDDAALFETADAALYRAKTEGRDRVETTDLNAPAKMAVG